MRLRSAASASLRPHLAPLLWAALLPLAPAARGQLDADGGQLFQPGSGGVPGAAQLDARFGAALAVGDFDHDGRLDLAIGVPGADTAPATDNGAVVVLYGDTDGLDAGVKESWDAGDFAALGFAAGSGDRFGSVLAVGNFDGDAYDDLAIAAPFASVQRQDGSLHAEAGTVFVLYGAPGGLSTAGQQAWRQGHGGLAGVPELGDRLGEALAAGDLDGDGYDDLAIGVPREDVGDVVDAGGVNLVYGSAAGLITTSHPNLVWTQATFGPLAEDDGDRFGSALAIGDFWDDGADDLAIGMPDQDLGGAPGGGFVVVARGLPGSGLATGDATLLTRNSLYVQGMAGPGDRFGAAFAVGDFDGDGVEDLAIGSPGEPWSDGEDDFYDVGAVHVLRGHPEDGVGAHYLGTRIARAGLGVVAGLESFGDALAAGDFDLDGADELVIGAPGDAAGGSLGAGVAYLVDAAAANPAATPVPLSQAGGAPGVPQAYDGLGAALAAGDFDGNRFLDLAVGVPDEDASGEDDSGVVNAFLSFGIFTDDFETGTPFLWSDAVGE